MKLPARMGLSCSSSIADLFGWKIDVQSEEMGNYGFGVPQTRAASVAACFPTTEDMSARSYVTFYVQVDDLQAALDKVAGRGENAIMSPMEIAPGRGSIAMFRGTLPTTL